MKIYFAKKFADPKEKMKFVSAETQNLIIFFASESSKVSPNTSKKLQFRVWKSNFARCLTALLELIGVGVEQA